MATKVEKHHRYVEVDTENNEVVSFNGSGAKVVNWGYPRPERKVENALDSVLLITDVDGTITGNDDAILRFNEYWVNAQIRRGSVLVYNTGRPAESTWSGTGYTDLCASMKTQLLRPDVLISGEGSSVIWISMEAGDVVTKIDTEWQRNLSENWDVETVLRVCAIYDQKCLPVGWPKGRNLNGDEEFRIAITIKAHKDAVLAQQKISEYLGEHYQVTCVSDMSWLEAWIVTVMPAKGGKGRAAEFVQQKLKIFTPRSIWAGDSGNDLAMLTTSISGIIVGNACQSLVSGSQTVAPSKVYHAKGLHADGVLEGLQHFFPHSEAVSGPLH